MVISKTLTLNEEMGDFAGKLKTCFSKEELEQIGVQKIYGRNIGDTVFRRITPIACILIWAELCKDESRKLKLVSL